MPFQTAVIKSHIQEVKKIAISNRNSKISYTLPFQTTVHSKGSNKRTVLNNSTGHQNPRNLQIVQGKSGIQE